VRKRVCVIGAGIAGLTAAYELTQRDHHVTLLEASDRCGGRICTYHFADGTYGELGAMRIPANHRCTLHYVQAFGLPTRPFVNHNPAAFYHLRGIKTPIGAWANLLPAFELRAAERADPLGLYEDVMKAAMTALSSAEKWAMFTSHMPAGRLHTYDAQSLWQYLCHWLSPEGLEYVGHATGMLQYERASLLEVLIDYFGLFRVDQVELVGGMATLPAAFLRHLQCPIHYHARVTRVRVVDDGLLVEWSSHGRRTVEHFDAAICALPAPALARVVFEPSLPSCTAQALRGVTYASAAKTLFHCRQRPWEVYDGIYGGGSFTDLPIQQAWYPSDNSRPSGPAVWAGFSGDEGEHPTSQAPQHWLSQSAEVSHGPGVLTAAYMWEGNARRFLALSPEERTETVLQAVRRLHPQIDGVLDDVVHCAWDEHMNPGYGAFAYFAPGEHARYQAALCTPYPAASPRVFFAGEHLAIAHAWIQGAIQTALTAIVAVLQAPVLHTRPAAVVRTDG